MRLCVCLPEPVPYSCSFLSICDVHSDFLESSLLHANAAMPPAPLFLGIFPQSHHSVLWIGEECKRTHTRHLLLLDMDLSALRQDTFAVSRQIIDVDVQRHVAGPGFRALRLENPAVDTSAATGLDDTVVELRSVLDLPSEDFLVEGCDFCWILRHQFPVNNRSA